MNIGQTSFVVFITKVLGSAFGFIATVYFARILGAEILGQYFLILSLAGWLGIVGELGFSSAISKRISENKEPFAYLIAGFITMAMFGIILSAVVFALENYINNYVGTKATQYVIVLLLVTLFSKFVQSALNGQNLVHISSIVSSISIGARSVFQIGLVILGWALSGMIIGYATGVVIMSLIGMLFLSIRLRIPTSDHILSLIEFAKYSWLGSIQGKTYNEMDIIFLGIFVSSALVGIYSVAWSIAAFLTLFGKSIDQTLFPRISKIATRKNSQEAANLVEESIRYAGLITIPGLVGGTLLSKRIMLIYGSEFSEGALVLPLLISAVLINGYQGQFLNTLNAFDRPDLSFQANIAFIIANIVLNVILIPTFGIYGAAMATLTSTFLALSFSYFYVSKLVNFKLPLKTISHQIISSLLMGGAAYISLISLRGTYFAENNLIMVVGLVILAVGIYFITLLGISQNFRKVVIRNSPEL